MSMICAAPGWSASSGTGDDADTPEPADVVLLQMSGEEGQLDWVQRMKGRYEHAPLVVLASGSGGEAAPIAASVGAKGWLSFSLELEALLDALRRACAGETHAASTPKVKPVPSDDRSRGLTTRETEIVRRLSAAQASPHIAESMGISSNTLRTHLRNIMVKLGAHSRVEIVARARQLGLLHAGAGASH